MIKKIVCGLTHTPIRQSSRLRILLEAYDKRSSVHVTGSTGNNTFQIELADASDPTKMPAIGIVYEDIPINGQGAVVTFGRANGIVEYLVIQTVTHFMLQVVLQVV
jgi:hypothetical protein